MNSVESCAEYLECMGIAKRAVALCEIMKDLIMADDEAFDYIRSKLALLGLTSYHESKKDAPENIICVRMEGRAFVGSVVMDWSNNAKEIDDQFNRLAQAIHNASN